jgi:hypothetical protein
LESGLPEEYSTFEKAQIGNALVYRGEVELEAIGARRRLAIIFNGPPSRTSPIVMADGPRTMRHRFATYRPSALCLWYAKDHPTMRWRLEDGLANLIDLARVHLVREAWFRETGIWSGPEVHRDPNKRPIGLTAKKRYERRKCWCGRGARYTGCHGLIPQAEELALLGLAEAGPGDRPGEVARKAYSIPFEKSAPLRALPAVPRQAICWSGSSQAGLALAVSLRVLEWPRIESSS